ncbi:MAG: hypothetical protein FH749_10850 [Firmicutes bacterium]|nr:hypothetical protein [Bacillota bacterium]
MVKIHDTLDLERGPWVNDKWWVSQYNFVQENELNTAGRKVEFHDSTLRDGEQAAGVAFNKADKLHIARLLDKAGVQYIEAGFPAVSEADQKTIEAIVQEGLDAKITVLSRATVGDIELAHKLGVWGAIIELPASYPRLKYQFGWEEEQVIKKTLDALYLAKEKGLYAYLFMIDSTRGRYGFMEKLLKSAVTEGIVDRVSLVDTNGCINPTGMRFLAQQVKGWIGDIPLEVHCHNDMGLAVANSLTAVEAGANSIASTLNGLGQRAGNAPTEELAVAAQLLYGCETGIDFKALYEVAKEVQQMSKWQFPPNKPVSGDGIYTWEAGIPTAALMKNPHTVEPVQPEVFGRSHKIVLGKKSGKANVIWKLDELGFAKPTDEVIAELVQAVKNRAVEKNGPLTDEEYVEILNAAGIERV